MLIRPETPADAPAVRAVLKAAFPGPDEARLVDELRRDGDVRLSLVAAEDGEVLGHVLFSPLIAPFRALGLAPLAVLPRRQREGIGGALVREGLARAGALGWDAVFVLGEPAYYRRFGFDAAAASGFSSPYAGPYLMAVPLNREHLPARTGAIVHAPAFAAAG